jgi:hypothetical protein
MPWKSHTNSHNTENNNQWQSLVMNEDIWVGGMAWGLFQNLNYIEIVN